MIQHAQNFRETEKYEVASFYQTNILLVDEAKIISKSFEFIFSNFCGANQWNDIGLRHERLKDQPTKVYLKMHLKNSACLGFMINDDEINKNYQAL